MADLGIRSENRGRRKRRAPLTPQPVDEPVREHGLHAAAQPSPVRGLGEDEVRAVGVELLEGVPA